MVGKVKSMHRSTKPGPAAAPTGYAPIAAGPVRKLTDDDFDRLDARIAQLSKEMDELLAVAKSRRS